MPSPRRAQVISAESLSELTRRSDRIGLLRFFQHIASLGACVLLTLYLPSAIAWLPYTAYSILLMFSFCPAHEAIHGSAFATKALNRAVGFLFGLVLVLPPRYFESFHMAHHRFTQLPGQDPELLTPKPGSLREWLWHVSGIRYWLAQCRALLGNAAGRVAEFVPAKRRQGVINEARLVLLIYLVMATTSVLAGSTLLIWWWLLPALIGQPFLRLFLLAEHTGCLLVKNMFENTRTTYTNRAMGWLCWNMNHHTVHHAYAGVPFWRLAEASRLVRDHLREQAPGYLAVNRDVLVHLGEPVWRGRQ